MSIFDSIGSLGNSLQELGNNITANSDPEFAQVLMKKQQLSALQNLASQSGVDLNDPQQQQSFLQKYAAITGDLTPLLSNTGVEGQLKQAQINNLNSEAQSRNVGNAFFGGGQSAGPSPLQSMSPGPNGQPITWDAPPAATGGTAGATPQGTPLSVQNNNPGNMRGSDGNFLNFSSPEDGIQAMQNDLNHKISGDSPVMISKFGKDYQPTLSNIISTWAPSSDGNNTNAYVQAVSKETGIKPDQKLKPDDVLPLVQAMTRQEGGDTASQYFGMGSNTPTAQPAAQTIPATAQPQTPTPVASGADFDPRQAAKAAFDARTDLNWDYLKQLPPQAQGIVKGLASGDINPSQLTRTVGKDMAARALSAVEQFDPNFSTSDYNLRNKTLMDLAPNGKTGQNLTALNTFLEHFGDLSDKMSGLNNRQGPEMLGPVMNAYNSLINRAGDASTGKVTGLDAAATTSANELAKALTGGKPALAEVSDWKNQFDRPGITPAQQIAVKGTIAQQVANRLGEVGTSVVRGLNISDPEQLLSPKARAALDKIRSGDTGADTSNSGAMPTPEQAAAELAKRKK